MHCKLWRRRAAGVSPLDAHGSRLTLLFFCTSTEDASTREAAGNIERRDTMRCGRCTILAVLVGAWIVLSPCGIVAAETWKAGAARVNITPEQLMWMSGYGGRDHPAEGKLTDLWAKALVLEDAAGTRVAAVTLDLCGLDRDTSLAIRDRLREQYGFDRSRVALLCSHTHTGPVVGRNLKAMYALDDEQWRLIDDYTAKLIRDVVQVVGAAVASLEPATLSWGTGSATFAVNRRNNREADVPDLRNLGLLQGPVDHDVPVLAVHSGGQLKAVLFGYACHATVLSFYQWSGDYPAYAMLTLEQEHPDAVALFWAGCGADQNPLPRRTPELAQEYGQRLANAVGEVLHGELQPLTGALAAAYNEIDLRYADLPSREQVESNAASDDKFEAGRAKLLLQQWDAHGRLSPTYPYPVQTCRLGNGPTWVILGGEVVVDYVLRLKSELGARDTWVAGYANDVMAYIPSLRVLREGRYEGATAMVYYGLPSPWAEDVEELIVGEVHRQSQSVAD
jgi:hypothetical protein